MKPLVDANRHTEAIERSPIQFSPILYKNPGSKSGHPGQTILFGCPPDLHTDGQQKKVPPILEYLLNCSDSSYIWNFGVCQGTDIITNN
jgi:hypothetical protein